jgi:cell wall-associated NlpC family hydrolase
MLPEWAGSYVGLPFRPHGRSRAGLDCWGLYRLVRGERFGEWLDGFDGSYIDTPEGRAGGIAAESGFALAVPAGNEIVGDAVFLRAAGVVCHIGMVLGGGSMLHIRDGAGSTVEPYCRGPWVRRVEAFRRP